jgi:SlyX protein
MPPDIDEAVEHIQSKIAFLEHAFSELSDVVFRQDKEIQLLQGQLKAFRERLEGMPREEPARTAEQERPPHY